MHEFSHDKTGVECFAYRKCQYFPVHIINDGNERFNYKNIFKISLILHKLNQSI